MKKQFEMNDEEFNELMEIARNLAPYMLRSGGVELFESAQDRSNRVWKKLGEKYGFKWYTGESAGTGNQKQFLAEPV